MSHNLTREEINDLIEAGLSSFADLSPYAYHCPEQEPAGTVNIGWLDPFHAFPRGPTSEAFRAKLGRICTLKHLRVNQTRGFHRCPFCRGPNRPGGSYEVRVTGRERVYAAPVLVHHYVTAHDYRPPDEFVEAVLAWVDEMNEVVTWLLAGEGSQGAPSVPDQGG